MYILCTYCSAATGPSLTPGRGGAPRGPERICGAQPAARVCKAFRMEPGPYRVLSVRSHSSRALPRWGTDALTHTTESERRLRPSHVAAPPEYNTHLRTNIFLFKNEMSLLFFFWREMRPPLCTCCHVWAPAGLMPSSESIANIYGMCTRRPSTQRPATFAHETVLFPVWFARWNC